MYCLCEAQEEHPAIVPLEAKLCEVAALPDFLQGLVYILPLYYQGKLFVRYLCTGTYTSVFTSIIEYLSQKTRIPQDKIFPWEIFTPKDLHLQRKKALGTRKKGTNP